MLDDHFGPVLGAGGIEFDDLAVVMGDDCATILWCCAIQDFRTQDFEIDGGNIVDDYLKRRGWKEGAQAKARMRAVRTSVMSLYEVSASCLGNLSWHETSFVVANPSSSATELQPGYSNSGTRSRRGLSRLKQGCPYQRYDTLDARGHRSPVPWLAVCLWQKEHKETAGHDGRGPTGCSINVHPLMASVCSIEPPHGHAAPFETRMSAMAKFTLQDVGLHIRRKHPGCPDFAVDFFSHEVARKDWNGCKLGTAVGITMQNVIRHQMTDYDQLLLIGIDRNEAKRRVQPKVNAMIASWRKHPKPTKD